jgi:hypothetical protein
MTKLTFSIATLLATILSTLISGASGAQIFTGEIMDVQCGLVKSHEMMMRQKGSKDPTECTQVCIRNGGKAVLYDPAHKKVYQLEDQQKALQYAGQRVVVTGTYDNDNNTIRAESVHGSSQ